MLRDLVNNNGYLKNERELMDCLKDKCNVCRYLLNFIIRKINYYDLSIAPYIKIKRCRRQVFKNKIYNFKSCTSKFHSEVLCNKANGKGNME